MSHILEVIEMIITVQRQWMYLEVQLSHSDLVVCLDPNIISYYVIYETRVPVFHHGMKTFERDERRGEWESNFFVYDCGTHDSNCHLDIFNDKIDSVRS